MEVNTLAKNFVDHMLGYWGYERNRVTGAAATLNDSFRYSDSNDVVIGTRQWDRTLQSGSVQKLNRDSWIAYRTNPIYQMVIEMVVAMIVGNKSNLYANGLEDEDPANVAVAKKLQSFLSSHWDSEQNRWANLITDMSRDMILFGEVIPIPAVNTMDGSVFWGFVPPESIKKIVYDQLNTRRVTAVVLQDDNGHDVVLPIVSRDRAGMAKVLPETMELYADATNATTNRLTGRCMYWAINRALTSARGTGDFIQAIRPAKDTVKLVSSVAERARINNKTVGDVQFPANWTQEQINAALNPSDKTNYINPPRVETEEPQLFGHSEGVQFKFTTPQIGASENAEVFTMLKAVMCVAAHNAPEHLLFGQGVNANRATAAEMGAPFYEYLNTRQTSILEFVREAVDFAIDQKLIFTNELDGLTEEQLRDYTIYLPKVNLENVMEQLDATNKKLQAVTSAKLLANLDNEQTAEMVRGILMEAGIKIPEQKESQ